MLLHKLAGTLGGIEVVFFHVLYDRIQNTPVPHGSKGSDVVLWKHSDDVYKPSFSTARTWNQI